MKLMKKITLLLFVVLFLAASLSACSLLENAVSQNHGKSDTSNDDPQSDDAESTDTINKDVLALIGISNGKLKELLGNRCYAYLQFGGTPTVDYSELFVDYPFSFVLDSNDDWETAQQQIKDMKPKGGAGYGENPFSDEWPVSSFYINADQAHVLFGGAGPFFHEDVNRLLEQEQELIHVPASGEDEMDSYNEYYYAKYLCDSVVISIIFDPVGDNYQLMGISIYQS
jgi:hypothetical protein